jgi:diaminopimelate decarboxylase
VTGVWPRTAAFADGRLARLGGVDVDALAREHGTPLYVLDHAELVGRMRAYRDAFGDDVAVTYAGKALCVVGVLQIAAREGLHLDVASGGELHTAARAGFPMERVLLHGNNKSEAELAQAATLGVGRVVADSFSELERLSALGERLRHDYAVLLRITPGVTAVTHDFIRTGDDDSKFGFTLSAGLAHAAVERALALPRIDVRGLHCHVGSQVTAAEVFSAAAVLLVGLLDDVRTRHCTVLGELNVGGGLGIAYAEGDDALDVRDYARALREAVSRECSRRGLGEPRLAVEPGRSIVGPAGVTLYTVGTVKEVPGVRTYVSVDGGMSDNPRPALYGARYTFAPAGRQAGAPAPSRVTVVGKHCESGDVLGRDVELGPGIAEGELLAVAATGGYAHSMSSNYNRLPRPAMVLVADGEARVLVRRETLDDVVARDAPLEP